MDVRRVVFAAVVLGLVGTAAWLAWWRDDGTAPAPAHVRTDEPADAAAGPAHATSATPDPTDAAPGATATERELANVPATAVATATATVRGRCVDGAGRPLAEAIATLTGTPNERLLDAWLRDHDRPDPQELARTTGADGVFAFTFAPLPPLRYALAVTRAGCGTLSVGFLLEPGATVDLGDVELLPGVQLSGTVVDAQQRPVPDVEVRIHAQLGRGGFAFDAESAAARARHRPGPVVPDVRSDAAGRFRLPALLPPGPYVANLIHGGAYRDGQPFELRADRPVDDLTLRCSLPADAPTLTGRVVDDQGLPVAGATIQLGQNPIRTWQVGVSGPDGTFRVPRSTAAEIPDTNVLWAHKSGYLTSPVTAPLPWDTHGVELRLGRGGTLVVRVTDAQDRPVERFSVRVVEDRGQAADAARVRARGPFANGTATISGLGAGELWLGVEFPTASGLVTHVAKVPFDGERGRVDVQAEAAVARTLRVVDRDGAPVAGTRVELLDHTIGTLDTNTDAVSLADFVRRYGSPFALGLLVAAGTTAADGTFVLRGSARRPLGLRLLGDHIAHCDGAVDLGAPGELVVTVRQGARLLARITPPAALDELRRRAGLEPGAAFAPRSAPWLQLFRPAPPGKFEAVWPAANGDGTATVAADGRVELASIPPGTWRVGVRHWHVQDRSSALLDRIDTGEITLADEEVRELALDLTFVLPGTLEAVLQHNGRPLADHQVVAKDPADERATSRGARTDEQGRFRLLLVPGHYVVLAALDFGTPRSRWLPTSGDAEVFRDRVTRQTFHLTTGTLALRLRRDDGAAAPDVALRIGDAEARSVVHLPATDAEGTTRLEVATGTFTVFAHRGRNDRVAIGTVEVRPDQTTDAELRLPADW